MIRNLVFDLGNVLVNFDGRKAMHTLVQNEEKEKELLPLIFKGQWAAYDRGDLSVDELMASLKQKRPDFSKEIERFCKGWTALIVPQAGNVPLLLQKKAEGYGIYILSNLPLEAYQAIEATGLLDLADGGIYSYQEHLAKPEEDIYRLLESRFGLKLEETLFFDDRLENVQAARQLGMQAVQVPSIELLPELVNDALQQAAERQ
jgi:putative hydrolase of the HAD superfamily